MKLTCRVADLRTELQMLDKIVSNKPVMPTLGFLRLSAHDGLLQLIANDHTVAMKTSCKAEIEENGGALVPAKRLLDLVKQFKHPEVIIGTEKDKTVIRCGNFASRLQTPLVDTFPMPPTTLAEANVVIDFEIFQQLLEQVHFAMDETDTRYFLNGVLLTSTDHEMVAVTTDGKRLTMTIVEHHGENHSMLIPARAVQLLRGWSDIGTLKIRQSERHLFFELSNRTLIVGQIDGKFPEYRRIIPMNPTRITTVIREGLLEAVQRVGSIAQDQTGVLFKVENKTLSVLANRADTGDAVETVPIDAEVEPFQVRLQWEHVADCLKAASTERMRLAYTDEKTAVMLSQTNDLYMNVLMPMRI